jgi:hypothetical protein
MHRMICLIHVAGCILVFFCFLMGFPQLVFFFFFFFFFDVFARALSVFFWFCYFLNIFFDIFFFSPDGASPCPPCVYKPMDDVELFYQSVQE